MISADAQTVLKCWLFISQVLKYKSQLYHISCVDEELLTFHSDLSYSYLTLIEDTCGNLQSDIICEINNYVDLVKSKSIVYTKYVENPCEDYVLELCDISLLLLEAGQIRLCLVGPILTQLP